MRLTYLALGCILLGCGNKEQSVSFHDQIQPILSTRCVQCHSTENAPGDIALTTYDRIMSAETIHGKKPLVVPGDPTKSWMFILAGTDQLHFRMPPDSSQFLPVPKDEVQLIGKWIQEGAKNN
jgi:uncharacterized membrane protein